MLRDALLTFAAVLGTVVVPVPEELTLLGAGYLARAGRMPISVGLAAAFLGVFVGDVATFFGARWLRPRVLQTAWGARLRASARRWGALDALDRHGDWTVVFARCLVGLRGPVYVALGASTYPGRRFLAVDALVGVVEVSALVGVGWLLGPRDKLIDVVRLIELGVAALLVFAVLAPRLSRAWLQRARP